MGFGGGASYSAPETTATPPAAAPATLANPAVSQAAALQKTRSAYANGQGFAGTIQNVGGSAGVDNAQTAKRSLLG